MLEKVTQVLCYFEYTIHYSYLVSIFIFQCPASVIVFMPQNPYSLLEVFSAL